MEDVYNAVKFIYRSYVMAQPHISPGLLDIDKRHPGYCRQLLAALDVGGPRPPAVSITGSKGKGSTAAIIASLFQAAGRRTGLFTGPHLVDFCERIRVDWRKIPEEDFVRLARFVKPQVEKIQAQLPPSHYLGPVGIVLAIALLWFQEQGMDVHVLECGRGALADDVNVIPNRWSLLTPVMMEHKDYLGPTLLDIAANKAALVKSGQEVCVSHRQEPEVTRLLKSLCRVVAVPLKIEGEDFAVSVQETGPKGSVFAYQSSCRSSIFSIPLAGKFQAHNAGAAIALMETVDPGISTETLNAGLAAVRWPGRCQFIDGAPPLVLDGAINAQSATYLGELLASRTEPLFIVLGVPQDKDWRGVARILAPFGEKLWFTTATNRSLIFPSEAEILSEGAKYNSRCRYLPDPDAALAAAVTAAKDGGTVVVAGTMSLLRDAILYSQTQLGRDVDEAPVSFSH